MIIFRYLAREVLATMFAVSFILLLILLSGHFARLLSEAAAGKLDAGVLFTVIGFMSLRFLEIILSLGLFIGIILSYGRLYVDSEMTVMSACGISDKRLVLYTFVMALPVAMMVGVISLFLAPYGYKITHQIVAEQRNRTDFETIQPARFNRTQGGAAISYAESISDDKKQLNFVFMAQINSGASDEDPEILTAQSGETRVDAVSGEKYLVLKNGRRYSGTPGELDYEIVDFKEYHQVLPQADYHLPKRKITKGQSVIELWGDKSTEAQAAIHWRLSLPVLVIIIAIMAVPLSKTKPRKGRYNKLVPSILTYVLYVFLLQYVRGEAEKPGGLSPYLLWYVHGVFVVVAYLLFQSAGLSRFLFRPKKTVAVVR